MTEYLVFTLAAPMGAFGDLAGHERRGTALWPGRSAILGLAGAALGIRRDDATGQDGLNVWNVAVANLHQGHPLRDFHTAQPVPTARAKRPNSRRDALAALKRSDNAVITTRDYLTDCLFSVALWGGDVNSLLKALREPVFTPYLGRKPCPLSMPMAPRVVVTNTPVVALENAELPPWLPEAVPQHIMSDPFDGADGRLDGTSRKVVHLGISHLGKSSISCRRGGSHDTLVVALDARKRPRKRGSGDHSEPC